MKAILKVAAFLMMAAVPTALSAADKDVTIKIKGMHCHGCKAGVESALKKLKGVKSATVDFKTGIAKVTVADDGAGEKDMKAAIEGLGYAPISFNWSS